MRVRDPNNLRRGAEIGAYATRACEIVPAIPRKGPLMGYSVYYRGEISVTPPLTEEHAATLMALSKLEPSAYTDPIFAAIASSPEPDLPGYGGLLDVSGDGSRIVPEEDESRHGVRLWLRLMIEHFLGPLGYVLEGEIEWTADDLDDRGCIFVRGNRVEAMDDLIVNPGPSWSPNHYVDENLKGLLRDLVDSADDTGCSPDLTVVSAKEVEALRHALQGL